MTINGMLAHERAFQFIANANGGRRASGTPGYDAAADYVAQRLRAAGPNVRRQTFSFRYYEETAPAELQQVSPTAKDYETASFQYSGAGDVTAGITPVDSVNVFAGRPGSGEIESAFHEYFAGQGLASAETPFSGRSDYGPFIAAGIPAGGLFTGAAGVKTAEEAAVYGGTAGVAYDPSYHGRATTSRTRQHPRRSVRWASRPCT